MKKSEFNVVVDRLLSKLGEATIGDYKIVSNVISEFRQIVNQYAEFLNLYVAEDIGRVKMYLSESRRYKRQSLKQENWNLAINRLYSDIESMKEENTFPD
jgi:hypothetical protein